MGKYWTVLKESIGIKRVLIFGVIGIVGTLQQWLIREEYMWASIVPPYALWVIVPLLMAFGWVLQFAAELHEKVKPKLQFKDIETQTSNDDEQCLVYYLGVENTSKNEDLKDCLVRVEKILDYDGAEVALDGLRKRALRTINQVGGRPSGRFNLDAGMEKHIFLFIEPADEPQKTYFFPEGVSQWVGYNTTNFRLEISAYGRGRVNAVIDYQRGVDCKIYDGDDLKELPKWPVGDTSV